MVERAGARYGTSGVWRVVRHLREDAPRYADWPVRLAFAAIFLFHGIQKLQGDPGAFGESLGLGAGVGWLVAFSEVAAGAFVLIGGLAFPGAGLITRLGGALAIPAMGAAIYYAHWPRWSYVATDDFEIGGMEFQVLIALVGVWFALTAGCFTPSRRRDA